MLVLLVVGAASIAYYTAPVSCTYRSTLQAAGGEPDELMLAGDALFVEREERLYLRIETRRDFPVYGVWKTEEKWTKARMSEFRTNHPQLRAANYWPERDQPHGGVAWLSE